MPPFGPSSSSGHRNAATSPSSNAFGGVAHREMLRRPRAQGVGDDLPGSKGHRRFVVCMWVLRSRTYAVHASQNVARTQYYILSAYIVVRAYKRTYVYVGRTVSKITYVD